MAKIEILFFIVFAALVCASESEEGDQKKRGAGKPTSLNAIPTGAQKPEYTYNIYSSQPSQGQSTTYQSQVPNSFYPSQNSQYYSPNTQTEQSPYQQPQNYLIPPTTSSQFVPLNFIPNPGYQTKYQLVPSKTANGNLQLILQQPQGYQQQVLQYPQTLLSPSPGQFQHQGLLNHIPQGHYNVAPNYQPLQLGNSYFGQPSMLLLAQPNPYNNLIYPNSGQGLYNYYPNSQTKYASSYPSSYSSSPQTSEYEKSQPPAQQSLAKEDNEIGIHNNEYSSPSDTSYKNAYATSRSSSYSKQ
ncbi:uncharacterized protein LOC135077902 [Ostrinia nubilalis]|uniref:uncharacterized protein LOC135077902 n=1 Tax=Ostrinia nubilalis TaxID=29057 RepID=UPI0030826ADF